VFKRKRSGSSAPDFLENEFDTRDEEQSAFALERGDVSASTTAEGFAGASADATPSLPFDFESHDAGAFSVDVPQHGGKRRRLALKSPVLIYGTLAVAIVCILAVGLSLVLRAGGSSPCSAADRFIQALNRSDQEQMQDSLSSRWRGDVTGFLTGWGVAALAGSGVKVSEYSCSQSGGSNGIANLTLAGNLSWGTQVGPGSLNLGSSFQLELTAVQAGPRWYLDSIVSTSLGNNPGK
jgi:hypothetical protein